MRFLKITLIVFVGLVCGTGAIVAYDVATTATVINIIPIPDTPAVPGPSFTGIVAAPERLIIPKINVHAHIKSVGLDEDGNMATPGNPIDVAWYQPGPLPGMLGSAVIDGHLNTKYVEQAVFYNLNKLQVDDEVYLRTVDGEMMTFKVVRVAEYAEDAPAGEIFSVKGPVPYLNLISCSGDWDPIKKTYSDRIVVFTERVE